jgi:PAS domain-containing protein
MARRSGKPTYGKRFIGNLESKELHDLDNDKGGAYRCKIEDLLFEGNVVVFFQDSYKQARLEGRYFENRYICKDGSYRVLEWTNHWEKDGTIFSIARDITEHKEAENLFELVIASSPISYILCDASGKMELVNEESEKLFGYKSQELIGNVIEMLIPANLHAGHIKERDKFVHSGEQRPMARNVFCSGSEKTKKKYKLR